MQECEEEDRKIEKSGDGAADKKGGGRGPYYVGESVDHFAYKHCGLCRKLEDQSSSCEEREVAKCVMLAKMNVPVNYEVELVATTIGAAREDGKEGCDSDSGAKFHMSHTQARMTAYKKVPPGTTVEVADETILSIDGFGTIEVDLDQPGTTTKPVKMVAIVYVPGLPRNLLSTRKAGEQWGKPIVYYETKAVFAFPRRSRSFLTSAPARDCFPQQVWDGPRDN